MIIYKHGINTFLLSSSSACFTFLDSFRDVGSRLNERYQTNRIRHFPFSSQFMTGDDSLG